VYNKILIAVISDPFLRLTTPEHDLTTSYVCSVAANHRRVLSNKRVINEVYN